MKGLPGTHRIGLALATGVLLAAPFWAAKFEPSGPLVLACVCAGSAFFAAIATAGRSHSIKSPQSIAVVLALAAALLSVFVSVNKGASLESFVLVGGLAALWLAILKAGDERSIHLLAAAVVLSASVVALWGVREYLSTWAYHGEAGRQWRVFSTFFNPNMLAGYLALTAPLTLGIVMTARAKALVWISAVGFWAQLGALALTGSRFGTLSGLVAIALFALGYVAISKTTTRRIVRAVVVAVVAVAVLAACSGPLLRRETAAQSTASAKVGQAEAEAPEASEQAAGGIASKLRDPFREHVWASTAKMWVEHPILGTGIGTFEYIYPAYATVGYTAAAHNGYLQALSEMGSLWIAVFALWVLAVARAAPRSLRSGGDGGALRLAAAAGLVGSALHSLYDYDWQIWAIPATICAVLVIALGPRDEEAWAAEAPRGQRRGLRFALLSGAAALAAVSAVLAISHRYADLARSGDLENEQRIGAYRKAMRCNPLNGEIKRELGGFLVELSWHEDDPALGEEGIALMRTGCGQAPTDAVGWYQLGRALDETMRTEDAIEAFQKAIRHSRVGTPARVALADIYLYSDNQDAAEELFAQVVEIQKGPVGEYPAVAGSVNPDGIAAHVGLGEIHLLRGKYDLSALENTEALRSLRAHQIWMLGLGGGLQAIKPRSQEELDAYLSASHAAASLATIWDERGEPSRAAAWSDLTDILTTFAEAEDAALNGDHESARRAQWDVVDLAESAPLGEPLAQSIAHRAAARALQKLAIASSADERDGLLRRSKESEKLATRADAEIE